MCWEGKLYIYVYTGDFLEVDISGGTKSTTVENDLGRKTFLFRRYYYILYGFSCYFIHFNNMDLLSICQSSHVSSCPRSFAHAIPFGRNAPLASHCLGQRLVIVSAKMAFPS